MDAQHLADAINDRRAADVMLTFNSGEKFRLTLDARAILQEGIGLYIIWPIDGNLLKVRRGMMIGASNVSTLEFVPPEGEATAA